MFENTKCLNSQGNRCDDVHVQLSVFVLKGKRQSNRYGMQCIVVTNHCVNAVLKCNGVSRVAKGSLTKGNVKVMVWV